MSVVFAFALVSATQPTVTVSAQHAETFELNGSVAYGGGSSLGGALGISAAVVSPPVALATPSDAFDDIVDASSNGGHTLIARRNGTVWAMGANERGQLGLGYAGPAIETLTQIPALQNIVRTIAAGESSYALDSAGTLWVWGDDSFGQLGIGNPGDALMQPTPVASSLQHVTDVDASLDFAVAATNDGAIWAWGANASAQLGAAGPDRNMPHPVSAPEGFLAIDVAAGGQTVLARSANGDVMGWGANLWRQLADAGDTVDAGLAIVSTGVIAIGVGDDHIVMARADGTVQARGANWAGQLGNGWLMPAPGLQVVAGLTGVVDVAAGSAHSVAVTATGEAYAWGFNPMRQLLLPTPDVFSATPLRAMDVPLTSRAVRAKAATTILLNDPGALAVTSSAPAAANCGETFAASISIRGFAASGGEPDQQFPGVLNMAMTLTVSPNFELAAPATVDAGAVTVSGDQIAWSIAALDTSTATLQVQLRATGSEGAHPLFGSTSYVSSVATAPTTVLSPITVHPACSTPDVTPPAIASVTPSLTTITPPNRQMIPVTIAVDAVDDRSAAVCVVTGVTANESIEGDWAITAPLAVALRAERDGHGSGRVYRVAVACADESGNTSIAATTVTVPKGRHDN